MDDNTEKGKLLKEAVLAFLDTYAESHEALGEGMYTYVVKDLNSGNALHLAIYADPEGSYYKMFASMGPLDMKEEEMADEFCWDMSYLMNAFNANEFGAIFYVARLDETTLMLYAEQRYDTFDGVPTKEGIFRRLQDMTASISDAGMWIERIFQGDDVEDIVDDLNNEMREEAEEDEEGGAKGEDNVIPFPLH